MEGRHVDAGEGDQDIFPRKKKLSDRARRKGY
jgi:hypothetical protein